MIKNNDCGLGRVAVFESKSLSPYENLAIEKYIMTHLAKDETVLYLWRNADTVVIGRNQNCWRECHISELIADKGHLARRLSGGGAVYHDAGNLNFSFIARDAHYDVTRQLEIIAAACRRFGIDASVSGRNDLLADGLKKFSGNAFFSLGGEGERVNCHHGCILIATDTAKIEKYLSVSKEKLQSKGVRSVRSRVINLSELSTEITADTLGKALISELEARAGMPARVLNIPLSEDEIRNDTEFFASDEWLYGRKIDFTDRFGARFDWGEIELCFLVSA
jgi:lipoate-protein ligase A